MNDVLRIATTGSVDDGKSTLIGRLLHDTGSVTADKLEDLIRASSRRGSASPDYSFLTDGLLAEREQGITIDVAHVFLTTPKRKFIIADTPGHDQYTRNMVTGASVSSVALILVDARNGSLRQTYRHFFVSHTLRLPAIIVCVNKMDLVGYREERYLQIVGDLRSFAARLGYPEKDLVFIPVSATEGDNVTTRSEHTPWYGGGPLLEILETIRIPPESDAAPFRFGVQLVLRSNLPDHRDYRAYAGKVASGTIAVGERITILPSRRTTTVSGIDRYGEELASARAGEMIALRLADDVDVSRGDVIVKDTVGLAAARSFEARLCWLMEPPLRTGSRYLLQHGVRRVHARIDSIRSVVHPETLDAARDPATLAMNDIGDVAITASAEMFYDVYRENKRNGAFILIEESSNDTTAVGVFV